MTAERMEKTSERCLDASEYFAPNEVHLIRSKHVAQTYRVQVMQPTLRRGERTRFPVVYVTDANSAFDMLCGLSRILQGADDDSVRFILVGIGYPGSSPRAGAVLRVRDFTGPGFPVYSPRARVIGCDDILQVEDGTKEIHGASDFQKFIEHELIPFIDATYQTIPGDRTYFGHSGGGQFGLYTLFSQPSLFRNYVASSPCLLFHGELDGVRYDRCEYLFDDARRFIASGDVLDDIRLYISVGTEEEFEPALLVHQLTSSFYRMVALLKSAEIPGLALISKAFPGETHMSVWPMAFLHGVKVLLDMSRQRSTRGRS